jgi:hypothetical protein
MRHDRAKVNRLRSFLSWKDVRKNAKDASGDQVEDVVEETNTGKDKKNCAIFCAKSSFLSRQIA